jgi:hypothetical protein
MEAEIDVRTVASWPKVLHIFAFALMRAVCAVPESTQNPLGHGGIMARCVVLLCSLNFCDIFKRAMRPFLLGVTNPAGEPFEIFEKYGNNLAVSSVL